jgi:cytochrome c oxidase assembly protein subunit 15
VAVWLAVVTILVFAMIVVGGATRLTDSGLAITEWRPITGAVPPLSEAGWAAEFQRYRRIPEYLYVNAGMSLAEFKTIYWWEWGHRFLGRIIGLAFAVPFLAFLLLRRIPPRLVPRAWLLLALGGLQGLVGWWMVASGLTERVDVLPERLTVHLGLALFLFAALLWTALDAGFGARRSAAGRWSRAAALLLVLVFVQCLLGGLVAGNDAGRIYTDWPLMNGALVPEAYGESGRLWTTLAHDVAAVQLHHRLGGYLLFGATWVFALTVWRAGAPLRGWSAAVAGAVTAQAALGVVTLMSASPVALGICIRRAPWWCWLRPPAWPGRRGRAARAPGPVKLQ